VTAPKKSNGKYVIPAFISLVLLITVFLGLHNVSATSILKERVHENEAVQRETTAEIRGDIKVLMERSQRVEKKIDKLLEK